MSENQYPHGGFDDSDNSDNSGHVDNSGFANAEPYSASSNNEEAHSQPRAQQTQFGQQSQFGQQNQQQPPFGQGMGPQGFPPQGAMPQPGPMQPGPMQPPRPPMHGQLNKPKGFFSALFDFEFRNFVTIDFAKIIYIIAIALNSIVTIGWVIFGLIALFEGMEEGGSELALGFIAFLVTLVLATLWFFTTTILVRVQIEFIVAAIRTAQNTGEMVEHQRRTEHGERY